MFTSCKHKNIKERCREDIILQGVVRCEKKLFNRGSTTLSVFSLHFNYETINITPCHPMHYLIRLIGNLMLTFSRE